MSLIMQPALRKNNKQYAYYISINPSNQQIHIYVKIDYVAS